MKIDKSKSLDEETRRQIVRVWNLEYPEALSYPDVRSFEQYLSRLEELTHYTARERDGSFVGWLATFTRDRERWLVMLVDSTQQRKGIGTDLVNAAKVDEESLCGWVVDHSGDRKVSGEPYESPLEFYRKNGFDVLDDIHYQQGKLSTTKIKWEKVC